MMVRIQNLKTARVMLCIHIVQRDKAIILNLQLLSKIPHSDLTACFSCTSILKLIILRFQDFVD
jgi:hypothetical protein